MTFTAVVPVSRSKRRFLYGITRGVAATPFREPFSTRVAWNIKDRLAIGATK